MPNNSSSTKMCILKALSIIDQHAVQPSKLSQAGEHLPLKRDYRKDTGFSVNRTLPAFMVQWRGGPSPYDSHVGDSRSSAAELWENSVFFDLFVNGEKVPHRELGPLKGHELLEIVDHGGIETNVKKNYFRVKVIPEQVHLNRLGTLAETTAKFNPAKDRQRVEREMDAINTETFFRHLRCQNFKYKVSCLRNYPHGALGIEESPYGDPGEIYGEQQRRLEEANRRAEHTMRGQNAVPSDHLIGPIKVRDDDDEGKNRNRGRMKFTEECSLFGGAILPKKDDEDKLPSAESFKGRPSRFRAPNAPVDHLLGAVHIYHES